MSKPRYPLCLLLALPAFAAAQPPATISLDCPLPAGLSAAWVADALALNGRTLLPSGGQWSVCLSQAETRELVLAPYAGIGYGDGGWGAWGGGYVPWGYPREERVRRTLALSARPAAARPADAPWQASEPLPDDSVATLQRAALRLIGQLPLPGN